MRCFFQASSNIFLYFSILILFCCFCFVIISLWPLVVSNNYTFDCFHTIKIGVDNSMRTIYEFMLLVNDNWIRIICSKNEFHLFGKFLECTKVPIHILLYK